MLVMPRCVNQHHPIHLADLCGLPIKSNVVEFFAEHTIPSSSLKFLCWIGILSIHYVMNGLVFLLSSYGLMTWWGSRGASKYANCSPHSWAWPAPQASKVSSPKGVGRTRVSNLTKCQATLYMEGLCYCTPCDPLKVIVILHRAQ
jgi:hypothetical protein